MTTDQPTLARRRAIGSAFSSFGALALASCGGGGGDSSSTATASTTTSSSQTTTTTTTAATTTTATTTSAATLSALQPSAGSLSPDFAATTTQYTVSVSNTVASITFTPTAGSSGAAIRVNGTAVVSGAASAAIALDVGSNVVSVVVTAADSSTTTTYTVTVTRSAAGTCVLTATETEGPYPLLAILSNTAVVRSNIVESKTGVPLRLTLTLQDLSEGCAPIANAAVYIWHCDKDGLYSGYDVQNNRSQGGLTYLRGIQQTDANGQVTFTTIYPGWYAGRITHIHAQVYLNNNLKVTATATTQLAFPLATTAAVYASTLYTKGQNTSVTSFAADNVFSDGTGTEMLTISGDTTNGYDASMTIVVA